MVISHNSQLGLRFFDAEYRIDFLRASENYLKDELNIIQEYLDKLNSSEEDDQGNFKLPVDEINIIQEHRKAGDVKEFVNKITTGIDLNSSHDSSYYYICDSVFKAAELIKIGEKFTGRTLKDINLGKYTYLMGKHRMVRFVVVIGGVKGFYYDDLEKIYFEFHLEMKNGGYHFPVRFSKQFSQIMQILAFVELGDIEVKMIEAGRNNGAKKKSDKITNTSKRTVYVVDSSWNQIIIRTTGFAVRGHFRLQACGEGLKDRKLIWVDAFEKHGYKRRPTGEIAKY